MRFEISFGCFGLAPSSVRKCLLGGSLLRVGTTPYID